MTMDEWQKAFDALRAAKPKSEPCPSCGHCPTCGRGGHYVSPWVVPMPYYQPYPAYPTYPVWCDTTTTITY